MRASERNKTSVSKVAPKVMAPPEGDSSLPPALPPHGQELATNSKLLSGVWCKFQIAQLSGEPAR